MPTNSEKERAPDTARIWAIAARARWMVPLMALTAIALSLLKLDVGPVAWTKPIDQAAGRVTWLTGETTICIVLALTVLAYWVVREREAAAADLAIAAAWLTGIPGMAMLAGWIVKGTRIMFATLRRKVYEQIRAEGHAEGHNEGHIAGRAEADAEWQAWWQRRTKTGTFVPDPDDPPPRIQD